VDVRPENLATVSSQMPGLLHSVLVDRGQRVEAGEVVAEIAGLPIQDLQLEMVQAHLEAELLDKTLERLESIRDSQVVAARFIWETESQRDSAVNRREGVKRTLTAMGMSSTDVDEILRKRRPVPVLPVRTPISGIVVTLNKALGEPVAEEEPLLEIQNLARPWIEGFVSELQARQIVVGTPARVRLVADPGFVGEATVVRSAQSFVGDNRTLSVWLEFADVPSPFMRRNLLARISATIDARAPQLAVPTSAVLRDGTRAFVFVQSANGLMERRPVELGIADDRYAAITKGLSQGEAVVIQGVAELQTTYASIR
jgi:cobalt-zinc-cadmium efflux system membrane fusion protein